MTVLTMRRIRQDRFVVTGPDIEPGPSRPELRPGTGAVCITPVHRFGRLARTVPRLGERKINSTWCRGWG